MVLVGIVRPRNAFEAISSSLHSPVHTDMILSSARTFQCILRFHCKLTFTFTFTCKCRQLGKTAKTEASQVAAYFLCAQHNNIARGHSATSTSPVRPPHLTMNNSQFRQLISGSPNQQNAASTPRPGATPGGALGTKKTSFVPMTPRAIRGGGGSDNDFARQVRERNAGLQGTKTKKFKSYAPKGVKLGAGYTDRAKARAEGEGNGDAEDKAERVKALEDQMKLGQISREVFEALRDKITGGDAASSFLVKGLDRQLLERVRRGEDVMGTGDRATGQEEEGEEQGSNVDDELEKLGEVEVEALRKEKVAKKGNMAPPSTVAGKKRSRDEIMAELKAQRQAAAAARNAAEPQLGDRWQKVSDKKKPKIEIDAKGREVITTVDENGVVKKRVRKQQIAQTDDAVAAMGVPDSSKAVLGADVSIPEPAKPEETTQDLADDDEDIFEGAGTDYNPLGNMPDDDDDDDSDNSDDEPPAKKPQSGNPSTASHSQSAENSDPEAETKPPATVTNLPPPRRNYFNDTPSAPSEPQPNHLSGIEEVLKKAAKMDPLASEHSEESREAREALEAQRKKHAQMLANQDRDLDDMDMGFGGSRNDDEGEDEEAGMKVKLAEWKGGRAGDDGWEEDEKGGREKRKRKPKKRKGDTNNMSDIMRVIEGRKGDGKK
jgi:hypothetical protein